MILGAFSMLAFAFLVVLFPLVWRAATTILPDLSDFNVAVTVIRYAVASGAIIGSLVIAHRFIAAGRRRFRDIVPGIGMTLLLWLVGGLSFGWYLDSFATAYVSTYGGLATAMVALVFLYWLAAMFLFGGEVNGTLIAARRRRLDEAMRPKPLTDVMPTP